MANKMAIVCEEQNSIKIPTISYFEVNTKSRQEKEANAEYVALAVNNLHILAEALEQIRKGVIDNLGKDANGEEIDFKTIAGACAELAEKALSNIK
jgi:hypothetical protein